MAKPRVPSSAAWTVYLLRCRDGSLYTGITNDIDRRLRMHAAGKASRYTRSRLPLRLVFAEGWPNRSAALRREAAIKRLPRRAKLLLVRSSKSLSTHGSSAENPP